MPKQRIAETDQGIQGELVVEIYDQFSRNMRDRGWNNVDSILAAGITGGNVLEIGPGPGYVGLEWLKRAPESRLTGCEISSTMIRLAMRNAEAYGLQEAVRYVQGNCMQMPFEDGLFDAVFSNGSLHEWESPIAVFNEIGRVLKPGGAYCITDMRRDVSPALKWMIYLMAKPKEIRPGFITSLEASYTVTEIGELLSRSSLKSFRLHKEFFGLCISGSSPA